MGSHDFFVFICVLKSLKIEILFIFFVVDNEIMTNIYYSSEIVLTDADL